MEAGVRGTQCAEFPVVQGFQSQASQVEVSVALRDRVAVRPASRFTSTTASMYWGDSAFHTS